ERARRTRRSGREAGWRCGARPPARPPTGRVGPRPPPGLAHQGRRMGRPRERASRPRWQVASPAEVALVLLEARFGRRAAPPDDGAPAAPPVFDLADFQADAVRRAARILARRRGTVVADSVGLGKTYVALAL